MNISGKTEERVFRQDTGFSENMTAPVGGKDHKFGFMIGAFNDGLRVILKRRDLFHPSDQSMIKIQRSLFDKYELTLEHSREFSYGRKLYQASFDYQQTFKFANFISYEKGLSFALKNLTDYPDWELKFSTTKRRNVFDSAACIDYFKYHTLPSQKLAVSLAYSKFNFSNLLNFNVELAMTPRNGAKHIKLEYDTAQSWAHDNLPMKFINYTKMGYLIPLTQNRVLINDKFFIHHNLGFNTVGHTELPAQQINNLKPEQELMLDDLGSHKYLANQFRVEFSNIPAIRALDLKAMWYLDTIYYPNDKEDKGNLLESLIKFTRVSHGIGINYALSPMLSISLYFNIGNFNARNGDDALTSCISLTFVLL